LAAAAAGERVLVKVSLVAVAGTRENPAWPDFGMERATLVDAATDVSMAMVAISHEHVCFQTDAHGRGFNRKDWNQELMGGIQRQFRAAVNDSGGCVL
jgi:hypothetical protein